MLKIQAILLEVNAIIFYDVVKEKLILEDVERDHPSIEFKNFGD